MTERRPVILRGVVDRAPQSQGTMENENRFPSQSSKERIRRISRQIDELLLTLERHQEMLDREAEMLLDIGHAIRTAP